MLFGAYYMPNDCHILPTLMVSAHPCNECEKIHAWEIRLGFLWWGLAVIFGDIQEI